MGPETKGRLFDPTAAIDRLRGIGDVPHRALKYCPTLVKYAVIGAVIGALFGTAMVGLAFFAEQRADSTNPEIPQLYDQQRISEMNRFLLDHPLLIAVFAGFGVVFGGAVPWINHKDEELELKLKQSK